MSAGTAERRRAGLAELNERIRELENPDDIAYAAAEILGRTLDVSRAGYGTIDKQAETVRIERDWNAPGIRTIAGLLHFRDYGTYIDDLKRGETVVCVDAEKDPRTVATAAALKAISAQAFINMPVTEQGGFVALLYLNHATARQWPSDEVAFVRDVAERTRMAVERRRAEAALRENEARLSFLDALGRATASSVDADAILATTTRMVGEHLGVSVCAYADMEPDQDGFTIRGDWAAQGSASIVGTYSLAAFGELAVTNLRAGRPLITNDNVRELPPAAAATFLGIGLAATICMPLVKQGRLTALMAIHNATPRRWTERELALLSEVTERSWAHIERVRSEAAVRLSEQRFREELEARVIERTAALRESEAQVRKTEQALQQAQKMEAIGNLTGGVAHDFNNLLMAVLGSLELLRKRLPADPALLKLVDNAMEGARRGESLTKRMLAFARRQDLKSQRIQPGRLVEGMTELLRHSLGPMIAIETKLPATLAVVEVDPHQLESALLNLAVNSRDAMNGAGQITISAREERLEDGSADLKPGHYVCLALTDTGEGMDDATLKRAAEPFFTTKGIGKGTGLGLSMVQGFAEQSGGALVLKSAPGAGTTAEIWLPVAGPASGEIPVEPRGDPSTAYRAADRRLSILAVDDDALVLMNTVAMLEDMGHEVAEAHSGQQALALLEEGNFDLVITDHAMPRMSGVQLAGEIRRRRAGLPVLLATGYAELPSADGALPRLTKPFTQRELENAVANTIGP